MKREWVRWERIEPKVTEGTVIGYWPSGMKRRYWEPEPAPWRSEYDLRRSAERMG